MSGDDESGSVELGTFSELVVDLDVEPSAAKSLVRISLRTEGRNGGLAIVLLALAVLSVVGIPMYVLISRGERSPRAKATARLKDMAKRIEASLAQPGAFGNPSLLR